MYILQPIPKGPNTTLRFLFIGFRSNCVPRVMKALRRHYTRPEFLPKDSESSHLDWMFMGGSGTGAQMHVSYWINDIVNTILWIVYYLLRD